MSIYSYICSFIRNYYRFQAGKYAKRTIADKAGLIHFSVDDCIEVFKDLTEKKNQYQSMFEQPILGYLRELHEKYQIKVCLYCYYEDMKGFNLSQTTDSFAKEFMKNSNWLKFGFHGKNSHFLYDEASAEEAEYDYIVLTKQLLRICGGADALTRVVRLSGFQGNRRAVLAMRDCNLGINGLFTADDNRKSYYEEFDFSSGVDVVIDNIYYYHTDLRIENYKWSKLWFQDHQDKFVLFTHEYYLLSQRMQIRLEKILCTCVKDCRSFSFFE